MKYLDVCSGISAPTVAWAPLGWECVGYSEVEKFPNAVLEHHYPDIPNYGDLNEFQDWPELSFQVLVGGTPCQSFSIAGLRRGLKDPRGNLSLAFVEVAARYRPRLVVWENVPGCLSTDKGRAFGSIIGALAELGYGVAWRVLDAQYFGVPQRRRRVFLVGYLRNYRRAAEILFDAESLGGDSPPSRQTQEEVAATLTSGVRNGGRGHGARSGHAKDATLIPTDEFGNPTVMAPLEAQDGPRWGSNQWIDRQKAVICEAPDVAFPLMSRMHKGFATEVDSGQTPIIVHGTQDPLTSDVAFPLQAKNAGRVNAIAFKPGQSASARSLGEHEEVACTLEGGGGGNNRQAVAITENQRAEVLENPVTNAIATPGGKPGQGYQAARIGTAVRRLTPLECERLQGFPDGYTDIPKASDTARYKALGNSMAVPVMRWIGERIQQRG